MFSNKELRSMIITLFFEQLLVMLVGIVDTFVVSSCGEAAVSGVSLVNQFNTIFIYLFTALASGGAIVVSQYIGNKDEKRTILFGGEYGRRKILRDSQRMGGSFSADSEL